MKNVIKNVEKYLYHFGLDGIEVYGSLKDEGFLQSRKVKAFLGYSFKIDRNIPGYHYKITFFEEKNKYFAYYKGDPYQNIPTKDYVVVHATGFRILSEEDILFFLSQFDLGRTRRFDIAADMILPIASVLDEFKELAQKGATFNGKEGEVETRYIGEKQRTKNKRQIIRIYDKQVDIYARGKVKLYSDYLAQDFMTRVELEVRSELARNVYYEDLFDVPHILSIFKNYLYKHTQLFESLPGERITLYRKSITSIDPELYQSIFYKNQRKGIFVGHAKAIYNLGFCPIRVLIAEGYIQDRTKMLIGEDLLSILADMEKKLIENVKEQKRKRKDFQNLLLHSPEYEDRGE